MSNYKLDPRTIPSAEQIQAAAEHYGVELTDVPNFEGGPTPECIKHFEEFQKYILSDDELKAAMGSQEGEPKAAFVIDSVPAGLENVPLTHDDMLRISGVRQYTTNPISRRANEGSEKGFKKGELVSIIGAPRGHKIMTEGFGEKIHDAFYADRPAARKWVDRTKEDAEKLDKAKAKRARRAAKLMKQGGLS
ncbi:hypothetical protein [Burkholderia phage BCSR5]|nr:hypothetical protein [Burkholderia phage BCSR5]